MVGVDEKAAERHDLVAGRETLSANYWKAKYEALQSATVATAWIATSENGKVLHLAKADGWNVEVVAVDSCTADKGQG